MKLKSMNPANQSVVGEVEISTKKDIQKAVTKAKRVFESWRETPVEERVSYVAEFAKEILKRKKEVAKLATLEMGKPYRESLEDMDFDQEYLKFYA